MIEILRYRDAKRKRNMEQQILNLHRKRCNRYVHKKVKQGKRTQTKLSFHFRYFLFNPSTLFCFVECEHFRGEFGSNLPICKSQKRKAPAEINGTKDLDQKFAKIRKFET